MIFFFLHLLIFQGGGKFSSSQNHKISSMKLVPTSFILNCDFIDRQIIS